jgi:hypothetical protein
MPEGLAAYAFPAFAGIAPDHQLFVVKIPHAWVDGSESLGS